MVEIAEGGEMMEGFEDSVGSHMTRRRASGAYAASSSGSGVGAPEKLEALAREAAKAEEFLKSIANAHRLMILCELHAGEKCVSELQQATNLRQSTLSQHLARLRLDALVTTRRESQTIFYSLADEKVVRTMMLLHDLFCGQGREPKAAGPRKRAARG